MDNKGKRETGELSAVWYGEPYEDRDEDAIDIRPRRQRRSVTSPERNGAASASRGQTAARGQTSGVQRPAAGTARNAPPAPQGMTRRPAPRGADQPSRAGAQTHGAGAQARDAGDSAITQRSAAPQITDDRAGEDFETSDTQAGVHSPSDGMRRQTSIPSERTQTTRSIPQSSEPGASGPHNTRTPVGTRAPGGTRTPGARRGASRRRKPKLTVGCVVRRSLLVLLTVVVFAVGALFAVANTLANGPSETARSKAVMSAMQASAVKWLPGLFLPDETINKIIADSQVVVTDVRPITDVSEGGDAQPVISEDRWAKAIDGMIYENVNGKTFKGYVLLIKDPSRISVAISDESFSRAERIFEIADKYGAIAAINGGEFPDNGVQTGSNPMGLTYAGGKCVWDDGLRRTFIGFTKENKLYVEEGTTREQADAAGVRDAVAFQTGNTLITNDGENVTYYYADSNTGVAQRTGIGQLADGTVMFLVTDGRTASSMGATKNDIIDTFAKYGAITAGLLDGGSSSMLYYRNWYDKYNVDKSQLDEWQEMGLVNRYKAFTNPRTIPTFFIVK